ncbi:zinc finger protein 84-like isoform X1 [Anopheles bellator]|uniref:zinc finger protein 84-like isoform X1 n=1 Tax=Anopheles bellator TaxID=139047 RepID=UPI002648F169|nr:zinc finger protein 84-like isoform X1 [Anopheles bellator]
MAEDLSINKNKIFARRYGNSNNDICRLCLKNEAHMEPLFYANLFPNILLTKKIYDCTSIQILYERNLPMFICKLCANKLDEYVRFRERCIANDEFLRNALAAFDMAGSCGPGPAGSVPMIKMEPEDTPPPAAKWPMELNCALVAAATAAAATHGHQAPATGHKQEPPDEEPMDRSEFGCEEDPLEAGCRTRLSGEEDGEEEDTLEGEEEDDDGGRYVCEVCPKSFKIRHHLHSHTHLNHQPSVPPSGGGGVGISGTDGGKQASYACPKCAKVFVNRGNLLNHLETHTNEKSYACDICSKSFKYNVQLRLHMRIHTGERPHKCEICNRGFSQLSNLRSHRKTHSKVKPYKCHLCLKSFTVADNLTAHSAKCLKDKFRCTLCSKSFAKEGNLLSHLQSHSEGIVEKMFKCEMCPKSFKNKEDWKRHVRVHTGEKPYTCDICSKGFAQKANLLSHRKTHLKPTVVFRCDRCDRTFRSQKVLEVHRPKCTGESAPSDQDSPSPVLASTPPGATTTTGATTTGAAMTDSTPPTLSEALSDLLRYEIALRAPLELQQMLLGHMDRKSAGGGVATTVGGHHGKASTGRRYRCDVCFKGYSQYPSLIKHRKLHFKVPPLVKVLASKAAAAARPYSCDICGKTFKYNRNLKVHAKLHIRANRFKCDKCPNTFAQAEALRHHLRTHPIAAERTFSCEFCSNLFRSKEDLNRHRRSHTGERPFRCQRCPKAFTQLSNLRAHARIHERKQTAYGDVVHMQQILTPLGTPFEDPDGDAGSPSSDGAEMEAHDGRNNRRGSNSKPSPVGKSRSGPTGVARARRPNGRLVGAGGKKTSPRKQVSMIPSQQQEVILIDDDEQQQQQHNNGMELNGAGSSGLDASGNALHRQLLQQIEESEANSLGPKLYPCESCSQTFAHLNNLKAHIYAEHDNDKPFKCKLCPISFKTKEILVMHMLLHSQHSSTI